MRVQYPISALIFLASVGSLGASTFNFSAPTGAKDLGGLSPIAVESLFTVNGDGNVLTITSDSNATGNVEILDSLTSQSQILNFDAEAFLAMTEAIDSGVAASSQSGTACAGMGTGGCAEYATNWVDSAAVNATSANLGLCATPSCTGSYSTPYSFERIAFTAAMGTGEETSNIATTYSTSFTNLMAVNQDSLEVTGSLLSPEPASWNLMAACLALGLLAFRLRRLPQTD